MLITFFEGKSGRTHDLIHYEFISCPEHKELIVPVAVLVITKFVLLCFAGVCARNVLRHLSNGYCSHHWLAAAPQFRGQADTRTHLPQLSHAASQSNVSTQASKYMKPHPSKFSLVIRMKIGRDKRFSAKLYVLKTLHRFTTF